MASKETSLAESSVDFNQVKERTYVKQVNHASFQQLSHHSINIVTTRKNVGIRNRCKAPRSVCFCLLSSISAHPVSLTLDLLTPKHNQFIYVPICITDNSLTEILRGTPEILRKQITTKWYSQLTVGPFSPKSQSHGIISSKI